MLAEESKKMVGRPKNPPVDLHSSNPDITLINVNEAAWLLRWDVTTVRRKITAGAIPAITNPRNPLSMEEANGLTKNKRSSKLRYKIQKKFIAALMYGTYVGGELQPMSAEQETEALDRLNAALREYEQLQENSDDRTD